MPHSALKFRCVCAAALVALFVAGCRRRDPYTDAYLEIVSAEKRDLEDQIYALEDKLAEREAELEAVRGRTPKSVTPPARGGLFGSPRKPASPPPGVMDDAELMPPMIDPGTPVEPKVELPPVEATPIKPAPKPPLKPAPRAPLRSFKPTSTPTVDPEPNNEALQPPAVNESTESPAEDLPAPASEKPSFRKPAADAELIDPQVSTLFINPFHTAGVDLDQQPGDDGLTILFEPRNAAGQFVPQAANVTIVALDPAADGDAARVARWELSKTEVGQRMLDTRPDRGVKVQLKWPAKRPEHGRLKLYVRYDAGGEKVEGQSDVFVTLPGQVSQRWTPRQE